MVHRVHQIAWYVKRERVRTDITFLVVLGDGVRETLIDVYVLFVRYSFIEHLGFGGIGDGVVQEKSEYPTMVFRRRALHQYTPWQQCCPARQ